MLSTEILQTSVGNGEPGCGTVAGAISDHFVCELRFGVEVETREFGIFELNASCELNVFKRSGERNRRERSEGGHVLRNSGEEQGVRVDELLTDRVNS